MIIDIMRNKDALLLGAEMLKNRHNIIFIKDKIPNLISIVKANSYKIKTPLKYNVSPAFIIGIINEFKLKENSKNSSFYFKYIRLRCYCFPFGYKNESEKIKNNPMCSDEDYQEIIYLIYHFINNINDTDIKAFSINKSTIIFQF